MTLQGGMASFFPRTPCCKHQEPGFLAEATRDHVDINFVPEEAVVKIIRNILTAPPPVSVLSEFFRSE
jgi:hypothetical protein